MHPIIIMWWWRRMKGQQRRRPYCCKQQFNARRTTTRWRHYTAVLSSSVSIRVSSSTLSHFPMFSTIPPKWFVARGRAIDLLDSSKVVPISNAKNRRDSYLPKKASLRHWWWAAKSFCYFTPEITVVVFVDPAANTHVCDTTTTSSKVESVDTSDKNLPSSSISYCHGKGRQQQQQRR